MARLSCDRICLLLLLVSAQTAFASGLVRQVSVSPQKMRQGDSITLEVTIKDLAATAEWIHEGKVICDGSSCNINSKTWGRGTHKLYLLLSKRPKQEIISFSIFVRRAKFGVAPKTIVPKKTTKFPFESISQTSKVVQAVKGSGFVTYGRRIKGSKTIQSKAEGKLRGGSTTRTVTSNFADNAPMIGIAPLSKQIRC